jgi:hypothetical protein
MSDKSKSAYPSLCAEGGKKAKKRKGEEEKKKREGQRKRRVSKDARISKPWKGRRTRRKMAKRGGKQTR